MRTIRRILAPNTATWLYCQGAILIVAFFALAKLAAHVIGAVDWLPFGLTDLAALAAIMLAAGALTWYRLAWLQRATDAAAARRRAADALVAENEAARRVARVVAREFAQPLSGALGYSELLMLRANSFADGERREVEGVREGVLQLERLVWALNQTAHDTASDTTGRCVADDVESCIAAPRPRLHARNTVAAVRSDAPEQSQ